MGLADLARAAMKETGLSAREHVTERPGVHVWFADESPRRLASCAICGVMRRADDKNKTCKGIVRVTLRDGGEQVR